MTRFDCCRRGEKARRRGRGRRENAESGCGRPRLPRRGNRQLVVSVGIAIVIELGLLLWFAHVSLQTIRTEERQSSPNSSPNPMEITLVQPKPVTPIPAHVQMPNIHRLPVMPKLAAQTIALALPPTSTIPMPSIDWRQALQDHFHRKATKTAPFKMPALPARPPSVYDLPERIRLPGGGEIDRIGDNCYAVPANDPITATGTNRSVLPRAMFAHAVPCESDHSFGSEFLKRWRERRNANRGSAQ